MACITSSPDRRRLFWATQPGACGADQTCVGECGVPGLAFQSEGVIASSGWLSGLIINMLMTDGRLPDTECGYRPGAQGGHWSESYIQGNAASVGTLLRKVPTTGTVREGLNLIVAHARATIDRLVQRGVALSVDVQGSYAGNNVMVLEITVRGTGAIGDARVGVSAARTPQGWIWGDVNGL
jgi:phage gp46-like protein